MKVVYIAGPYSAPTIIQALENIRRGRRMATKLILQKISPICPWLDSELFLQLREGETIDLETIQEISMSQLRKADAVLVLKGHEASKGTMAELKEAYARDIPVFFSFLDLLEWDGKKPPAPPEPLSNCRILEHQPWCSNPKHSGKSCQKQILRGQSVVPE